MVTVNAAAPAMMKATLPRQAGADEHVRAVADRAAEWADLANPRLAARPVDALHEAGTAGPLRAVAERAVRPAAADDPAGITMPADALGRAGADACRTALPARTPPPTPHDPGWATRDADAASKWTWDDPDDE